MISHVQDEHGFINSDECDSLLFTGLIGAAGVDIDIEAAQGKPGQWFRRPSQDCYPDHSKSTISRDMILGLLWYSWRNKRLDIVTDLFQYGRRNDWVMGKGSPSRTALSPLMINTIIRIIQKLDGKAWPYISPEIWPKVEPGYQRHIQTLHLLLRGEVMGKLSGQAVDRLKANYEDEPHNILFQAAHNLWIEETEIDISHYPTDRLPSYNDWHDIWPPQRSADDSGRLPGTEYRVHSGGEIIFIFGTLQGL
jgi:hypothetical protein